MSAILEIARSALAWLRDKTKVAKAKLIARLK